MVKTSCAERTLPGIGRGVLLILQSARLYLAQEPPLFAISGLMGCARLQAPPHDPAFTPGQASSQAYTPVLHLSDA